MANTVEVIIKQVGSGNAIADASKALGGLGGAAKGITGMLGGFASGLGNVATIAGGIVAANIFGKIVDGVTGFVSTGLDAVGASQQLETSLKALLTQNLMYEQTTETVTAAVTKQIMSQEELGFKYDELTAKLATQKATYQEQQEAIRQLTQRYGESGLAVIEADAKHKELALSIQKTEREIAGLSASETSYTTSTKQAWQVTMDQADAFKLASKQTKELLDFVSALAVVSPFETEDVENVTKYAIAAGMGVDSTKEFVPAFLDLAGAVGITSDSLGFAADQLFQVKKIGKLTEVDLRQLRRLGIDLAKIIGVEMGMSVEEFNKKAETTPEIFDELFASITKFSSNTFAGTAKEMATSVKGLKSTFSDIFVIGARTFLRPLVDAMTPTVAAMASKLSDFVLGGDMAGLGQQAAAMLMSGFQDVLTLVAVFGNDIEGGFRLLAYKAGKVFGAIWEVAEPVLVGLVNSVVGLLAAYWPTIQAQLFTWRDQFFAWIPQLYAQIPGLLTGLVQTVATFLTDNWPTISASLKEWSARFWDWATEAAAGAGAALSAVAVALMAWATSGEAQAAMQGLGRNLGIMLTDAMKLNLEGGEGTLSVITSLVTGLTSVIASVIGSLIILGGELVAGIVTGILQSLGVDLKPATFNELSTILTGIGADIATIAAYVGNSIVQGISGGITATWETLSTTINELAANIIAWFADPLGIASPSTVFFQFGIDLIQGLIDGIRSLAASIPGIIQEIAGGLLEGGANLFGSLFGGGEEGTSFDPTTMLAGLESIRVFLAETIPAGVALLTETFTVFFAGVTVQLTTLTVGPLALFITTLSTIYSLHIPTLTASWVAMTATIAAQIATTSSNLTALIGVIAQTQAAGVAMTAAIAAGMSNVASKVSSAANKIGGELVQAVRAATKEFDKMAEAAKKAADASKGAGGSAKAAGNSAGWQHGTGPGGFLVPPGFPNDSFLARLTSGERMFVNPTGGGPPGGNRSTTTNYYFNQTVNTRAESSSVISDFRVMQMLLGT